IAGLVALTKVSTLKQEVAALKKQLNAVIVNHAGQQQTQHPSRAQTVQPQVAHPIEPTQSAQLKSAVEQGAAIKQTAPAAKAVKSETSASPSAIDLFISKLKNQLQQNW
ncbi:hypothetical protein OS099_23805, partial [Escherichia coli]|uniref:hypothetical protein n=1 Tax=Escherichia coli TaxID=562 RepID=UPI00237A75EB